MKRSLALSAAVMLFLCAENVTLAQETRNPVLEYCTGTWCQWCPCGHDVINNVVLQYIPNAVVIGYHGPENYASEPYSFFTGNSVISGLGFNAYPTGIVDRTSLPISRSVWYSVMSARQSVGATVHIDITKSFDEEARMLRATISVTALTTLSGQYALSLLLMENGLVYPQTGNSSCTPGVSTVPDYVHNHVVRAMMNGARGDTLNATQAWNQGVTIQKSYQQPVYTDDPTHFKLVALVYKMTGVLNTGEIQQAMQWDLQDAVRQTFALAQPGVLYAASDTLFRINAATGAAASIGWLGPNSLIDLAIRPSTKELFGMTSSGVSTVLYRISAATGTKSLECTIPIANLRAIAFDRGDTLYGATAGGSLYRINMTSGDTVGIGTAPGIVYAGIACHPRTAELWASVSPPITQRDRIYIVNKRTGAATLVGAVGDNAATPCIAFSSTGILYGLKGIGGQQNSLIRIDSATAAGTLVGFTGISGLRAIIMRTDLAVSVNEAAMRSVPSEFSLEQNYPNPFNPYTTIGYQLPKASHVTLKVFNTLGQEVATLVDQDQEPGYKSLQLDASSMASGVYFFHIQAGNFISTKKLLVLR